MATLAQLENALVNAHNAGDEDAARRLAPIIRSERERMAPFAGIPGVGDNGQVADTSAGAPPTSIGDKVVGAGEAALSTATGATTGMVGMIGGMLKGLADNILSGKYGTQEGVNLVQDAAEKGASALTYTPRTQSGQEQIAKIDELAQSAAPLIGMAPELGTLGETAAAVKPVARAMMQEKVAPITQAATALAEQVKAKIIGPATADVAPTPGTGQSGGSAAVDMAQLRRSNAEELGFTGDKALTEGQAIRGFNEQRFEREAAKIADVGDPIRQRFQNQNLHMQQKMDEFIDSTGAELAEPRGVGELVDKSLRTRANRDKIKIRALYKEFEKSDEYKAPVDLTLVDDLLKNSASAESTAPVIGAAAKELARLRELNPTGTTSLGDAYQLRKFVNKVAGADPTNIKFAADIKNSIDAATKDKGGVLYQKANAARVQYANDYENFGLAKQLLNTKRGSTDRAIAMEDVLHKSVTSPTASLDTVTKLRQLLESEGETGQQAWKELQGGMLRHIRDEALKGVTTDSSGNRVVSASAMDRIITQLDKTGKLDYVLGKKKAEQIRTLNDVAKDVLTSPPGAVNTSNTATVLAGLLDVAISGATGVPAPIASTFRLITSRIKDAKLRARVKQTLGE